MQTERAKRMDPAGEEASLNSPELPWNQLYLKRRTESRIQLRRRVFFTGPAAAAVTGVLAILILAAGSVRSDSEFVTVPISVNCTEGQDCILSCTFYYTAWDETSGVIWRRAETDHIVHSYYKNTDQLAHQLPQYVNRTSLFDSELQRGNASLLLRRVREEDAGKYKCSVSTPRLSGSGLTEVVVVPAPPTTAPAHVTVPSSDRHAWWGLGAVLLCVIAGLCVGLWLYKIRAGHRWKYNKASSPAQAVPLSDVIEEPSEVRPLPCTAQFTQFNTSSQNEIVTLN
ncbi:CD276 antigen-like [Acipenser ruthenus]|uniref:CD276 antigen-like n=1 Tax=Acipenser ruthenus TaxID=7906 RepID=UPI0027417BE7|nr:CD276 antigen-like [Acipenser ruthenus]XP_058868248.1 CD276 antigen-like [Acipenser ruthenus]